MNSASVACACRNATTPGSVNNVLSGCISRHRDDGEEAYGKRHRAESPTTPYAPLRALAERLSIAGRTVAEQVIAVALPTSCWRTWLRLASLVEERGDLPGYPLVFLDLAVAGDEAREYSAAVEPLLLETPTFTLGCLARFLLGALASTGFCLRFLLTLALFLGLARGLGLQPEALGGEPLLLGSSQLREPLFLGSPLLAGGLFPGKLLGALTLEALALGALLGFPPGPGLPLFFGHPGAALGLSDLTASQVAAVGIERSAAVLLAHLARRIHRRRVGCILRPAAAAGREHEEEEDDAYVLIHGSLPSVP